MAIGNVTAAAAAPAFILCDTQTGLGSRLFALFTQRAQTLEWRTVRKERFAQVRSIVAICCCGWHCEFHSGTRGESSIRERASDIFAVHADLLLHVLIAVSAARSVTRKRFRRPQTHHIGCNAIARFSFLFAHFHCPKY